MPDSARLFSPPVIGAVVAVAFTVSPLPLEEAVQFGEKWLGMQAPAQLQEMNGIPNKMTTAAMGFVLGFVIARCASWLRWQILRILFAYRGWMYNPTALTVKTWALLVKILKGEGPHGSMTFQKILPRLPVPSLEGTCDKYLNTVKPLLTDKEFHQTKQVVDRFKQHEGPPLQSHLQQRSWLKKNWLSDWWYEKAYLSGRSSIAINSNFYCIDSEYLPSSNQLARAAQLIHHTVRFHDLLESDKLPVLLMQDIVPICMNGYRNMFSTCRIPGLELDKLEHYKDIKHIIIHRRGQYYKVLVHGENGSQYTPQEIMLQLEEIYKDSEEVEEHDVNCVAAFTAQNRTVWAKVRRSLIESNAENQGSLYDIEDALFHVCLDTYAPKDSQEQACSMLHGDGWNRWFDKSFTLVIFSNGRGGANAEHSTADATLYSRLWEFLQTSELYDDNGELLKDEHLGSRQVPSPQLLKWNLSNFRKDIDDAKKHILSMISDLVLYVQPSEYGKGLIKKKRMSPDGFIQMVLQLAYYRLHHRIAKTYESASTRIFCQGRTETIRPISEHSAAFVHAMDNDSVSKDQKIAYLRKAISYQNQYKLEAMNGEGCDRHLLGLYCASQELGLPVPQLFMDKAWHIPDHLSTSQTPTRLTSAWKLETSAAGGGFGPTYEGGYGIAYIITGEDLINFHITSLVHCEETNSKLMAKMILNCMTDMRNLLDI